MDLAQLKGTSKHIPAFLKLWRVCEVSRIDKLGQVLPKYCSWCQDRKDACLLAGEDEAAAKVTC